LSDCGKVEFSCLGGGEDVPQDNNNLVIRALELFRVRYGITCGMKARLFKRIPSQSGLGGGSSDAVAALLAARRLWLPELPALSLIPLAAELGSDCPLFLHDKATVAYGRGEKVEAVPQLPKLHFVLFKPAEGLSTSAVYAECMRMHDNKFHDVWAMSNSLAQGNLTRIGNQLFNRLEAPASEVWRRFEAVKCRLERLDFIAVKMSGSGTAFYGLCHNARHAKHAAAKLRHGLKQNETVYNVES
jgi:4-diphosphocytidyl-2-C-methyl-D-erythritol kinase